MKDMGNLNVNKDRFGLLSDGSVVNLFTVENGKMSFSASSYGPTLTSINLPDGKGGTVDVLLGFSTLEGWVIDGSCFGTGVGRFANRISGHSFELDGVKYELDDNDSGCMLHGGFDRWEKKLWTAEECRTEYGTGVSFKRLSPDGEQHFPGNVDVTQSFTLNEDNVLTLEYTATTDKPTPINITNHAYFNLKGYNGGAVYDQELQLNCDYILEPESNSPVPNGNKLPVADTVFDFTKPKLIGTDIAKVGAGYDHCYCMNGYKGDGKILDMGYVKDPASGRTMAVKTNQPGIQLYTGNYIEGIKGKNGFVYHSHGALCLETQDFPDAPNKSQFPNCILRPGEVYHRVTQYCFGF